DSLVVTHPTTNLPACGLSTAERTGSPIFHTLWSYVLDEVVEQYICMPKDEAILQEAGEHSRLRYTGSDLTRSVC
ncbi:hypothetical protein BO66DRAFT_336533, partial [Aspergillus aculeatinus CBS 121060]